MQTKTALIGTLSVSVALSGLCPASAQSRSLLGEQIAVQAADNLLRKADRQTEQALLGLNSSNACSSSAVLMARAAVLGAREDLSIGLAKCLNETDPREAADCVEELDTDFQEALSLAGEQYQSRLDVCALIGPGAYDPNLDEDDFSANVTNARYPLAVGSKWVYSESSEEGDELVVIEVLPYTQVIDDIECTVVRDTVSLDGELVEDTFDYFAQDDDGNVWYLGEMVQNYENGLLTDLEGSWIAGVSGAEPGIVMWGEAQLGLTYRQEFLLGEAEDLATFLSVDARVDVPVGEVGSCWLTSDFTPISPGIVEEKYYAAGIGFVYGENLATGSVVTLLSFTRGG